MGTEQLTKAARPPAPPAPASAWSPLRHSLFRAFWIAVLASKIGTWMQNTGAAWLMTSLSRSPALVALMQTATSLPTFVVGLPAGALADIVDRRKLLIATQAWMLGAALLLAGLTIAGDITPAWLLVLTLAIGLGVALSGPAWQATSPYLVPSGELGRAVALNGVAVNLGRAVGPAAGGLLLAAAGAAAVFMANSASFIGLIGVAALRWRPAPVERALPPERLPGAMRAGVRYLRHSPGLRAVLVRTALFVLGASALFGLLPIVARRQLGLGSAGFGLLLGVLGLGAIGGAWQLPRLRRRLPPERLALVGTLVFAGALLVVALVHALAPVLAAMLAAGCCWIALVTSFNVTAQTGAAAWVRARALAAYLLTFQGALALGSAGWGIVAQLAGTRDALVAAAVFTAAGLGAARRYPLAPSDPARLAAYAWAEPAAADETPKERGPVLVTVEYRIDPSTAGEFVAVMRELGRVRRRDGAYRWNVFRDVADRGRYLETFLVESWVEHLRQHRRGTVADAELRERVRALHVGSEPPVVAHMLAAAPGFSEPSRA